MKRSLLGLVLFSFLALFSVNASAADVFLGQSASGAATGADCSNARTVGGTNWLAGNTYHLCGTLSAFAPSADGTSTLPITILFEPGATVSMPAIPGDQGSGGGGIDLSGRSYINVDGGTNGSIQSTANGTKLANHVNSVGIGVDGGSHLNIYNLTFKNLFVNTCCSDGSEFGQGIYGQGGMNAIHFHDNTCTQEFSCVQLQATAASSDLEAYNNNLPNQDVAWGFVIVMGGGGFKINGLYIFNNDITPGSGTGINSNNATYTGTNSWCTGNSDLTHLDPIHTWSQGSSPDGIFTEYFYNNHIHGYFCVNQGTANSTTAIFWEAHVSGGNAPNRAQVFNNLIEMTGGHPGDGAIYPQSGTDGDIWNNTIDCTGADSGSLATEFGGGNVTYYNNVIIGCNEATLFDGGSYTGDYNDWYNIGGSGWGQQSFAQWKSAHSGQDTHSITSNPLLNADHTLQSGSPVINFASNLANKGIIQLDIGKPVLVGVGNTGVVGVARSATGLWDAGAYASGTVSGPPPVAPTAPNPVAVPVVSGHSATLSWTASVSTDVTSYNVKQSSVHGGPYSTIGSSSSLSYVDSTVLGGQTYFYVVTAVSPGGESLNSNEVAAIIPADPTPVVSISIAPTSTSIQTSTTKQFTATVTGSTNTAITWSTTIGTISTSGLLTAPATAGTGTVKVTSVADATKSASATVTVTAPVVSPYKLSVTKSSLSFTWQVGAAAPATQSVVVDDDSPIAQPFTVAFSPSWLVVAPSSAHTKATIVASINTTGLVAGTYSGVIVISAPALANSPFSIPVTLVVSDPPGPTLPTVKCTRSGTSATCTLSNLPSTTQTLMVSPAGISVSF